MEDRLYPNYGQLAQTVQPNPKCGGCLHYEPQRGDTGVCATGLRPWTCGDGTAPSMGYAPFSVSAVPNPNDLASSPAQAMSLGAGQVPIQTVVLGEEHAHLVKSMTTELEQSSTLGCHMHRHGRGMGQTSLNVPTDSMCTCKSVSNSSVLAAIKPYLPNRVNYAVGVDELLDFIDTVRKAGYSAWDKKQQALKQAKHSAATPGSAPMKQKTQAKFQSRYGAGAPLVNKDEESDMEKAGLNWSAKHRGPSVGVVHSAGSSAGKYAISQNASGKYEARHTPNNLKQPSVSLGTHSSVNQAKQAVHAHAAGMQKSCSDASDMEKGPRGMSWQKPHGKYTARTKDDGSLHLNFKAPGGKREHIGAFASHQEMQNGIAKHSKQFSSAKV